MDINCPNDRKNCENKKLPDSYITLKSLHHFMSFLTMWGFMHEIHMCSYNVSEREKKPQKKPKKCKLGNFQVFLQPDGAQTFWVALLSSPVPGLLLLHPCSCVSSQQYPQSCALVSAPQKQPRAKGDLSYS